MAIAREYIKRVMDDDVAGISAELAYRFMFATFPFAIFVVALAGFVARWLGVDDPSGRIIDAISGDLPANLVGPVNEQLHAALATTQPQLLSGGALLALVAATAGTSSMMKAMNRAYEIHDGRPLIFRIALAAALTAIAGVAIVISFAFVVGGVLVTHRFVDQAGLGAAWPWLSLVRWPIAFGLLVLSVTVLLRFTPDFRTPWHWAAVAAMAFAVVWLVVTYGFGVYVARYATYDATYGALAGAVILMLWFYLSSFVLICAAELAALLVRIRSPHLLHSTGPVI